MLVKLKSTRCARKTCFVDSQYPCKRYVQLKSVHGKEEELVRIKEKRSNEEFTIDEFRKLFKTL